jgi:MFS family permease
MKSTQKSLFIARFQTNLQDYISKVRLFRFNARLYMLNTVLVGISFGVFRLLFNFYLLSLGFDEVLIGQLLTIGSLVALVSALPAGYLGDTLGRKPSLLLSVFLTSSSVLGMVIWQSTTSFYIMNVVMGMGQSLSTVMMGPFLMENSGETERTYLFSFNMGIQMIAAFIGNWLGGRLPSWLGGLAGIDIVSPQAYGWSLAIVGGLSFLGLIPLLLLKRRNMAPENGQSLTPYDYARKYPKLLGKLISPMFITSIGAGLLMPFINVFFRTTYGRSDAIIGSLFATGSLAMAIGLLIAPPLADRWGKIRLVVITQGLSIPFLAILGFAPWYGASAFAYLVRLSLMNMSTPVYQAFVMEHVEQNARATVASLVSMSWSFGWAFSPIISGHLQVAYGFDPVFMGTIICYIIAILLYWRFFLRQTEQISTAELEGISS